MDNLAQLCGSIAEKHDRFLSQNRRELASLERILVLQEEIDQFNHWISSGKQAYAEKRAKAVSELEELKKILAGRKVNVKTIDAVKQKINEHQSALNYWRGRAKGV